MIKEGSEEEVILLNSFEDQVFSIYNSLLSEYGVMGFDYGYDARPSINDLGSAIFFLEMVPKS